MTWVTRTFGSLILDVRICTKLRRLHDPLSVLFQAPLVGRYHVSGKNPSSHLLFADWRRPGARIDVTVTRAMHGRARQGETWRLQVRPGRLGYAWIEALAPVAAR